MPDEAHLIAAYILGAAATLAATPVAIAIAARTGFHDRPAGYKAHAAPTPYLGGAAVLFGFLLVAATLGGELARLAPIVAGAAALWALGTLDDRRSVAPTLRVAAEAGIAVGLVAFGLGWEVFGSSAVNTIASVLWVVALVNGFNLMDNMDGAAGTVGAVTSITAAGLALVAGDTALAALTLGLAGACFGFLPYNLARPSRIFLGDGGSLPIGFTLAAALMAVPSGEDAQWSFVLAAAILAGLPVLDTGLVIVSRRRAGVPLLSGGRDHLTHRIFPRLGSPRTVAATLGAVQAVLGGVAIGVAELGTGSIVAAWGIWFLACAATVATLETEAWAPVRDAARRERPVPPPHTAPVVVAETLAIAFIVISCGLSPFLYGFYDLSVWAPITLFILALLLGLVIARPAAPRMSAFVAIAGVASLSAWSFVSIGWAESATQATTEANRWLLYAALLAVLVLLLRDDRVSRAVMAAAVAAISLLALYLTARMLVGEGGELFFFGRLHEPLGYINGQAGYLLLGFWPMIALAERTDRRWVSGLGVAGATLVAGLAILGQARAVIPAVVVSAVVVMVCVRGRAVRAWALLFVAVALLAALAPLLDVYDSAVAGIPDDRAVRTAAATLLAVAGVAGFAWSLMADGWTGRLRVPGSRIQAVWASVPAVVAGTLLVVALAAADPIDRVEREYRSFVELDSAPQSGSSRFTSGAGNRYDYWRVAWEQFADDPLHGVGAGNYDRTYFAQRRTAEDVRQPHSIEMQVLGELGVVGAAALALFVVAVLFGFARRASAASRSPSDRGLAVAAGGMFLVWLTHTSVDWLHLIPGVTGLALAAAAVLVGPWKRPAARSEPMVRRLVIGISVVAIACGAVIVGRVALAESYREDARERIDTQPERAVAKAEESLALDDDAVRTYYVKAAAHARLGDYGRARATLLEAARREPHDFVTWGLLGDLAVRRGELPQARRAYGEAARLNPRSRALAALAENPASALRR